MTQFSNLGLSRSLLDALHAKGYDEPTPIQRQAIPALLDGRDICGIAQTGTGKTAAFALPSLDRLAETNKRRPHRGCRMLVLAPTRELASQIAQSFRDYGKFHKMFVQTVFGGVPIGKQKRALERGTDVLVATPGRLLDLIDQRALHLDGVEIFVLDEADQMLDLGFIHALKRIDSLLPERRQSLFFSATMPRPIADLAARFLTDPVEIAVAPQATTAERVDQQAVFIDQREKQALLTMMLKSEPIDRALVFTRTKHGADRVVRFLNAAGLRSEAIHGNKSQPQRERALALFRSGEIRILVATDIAARGIDVGGVSHVFNFELPNVAEQYVHRIGRTARAGKSGKAIAFVNQADERGYLRAIEKLTGIKLTVVPLPENFRSEAAKLPKPAHTTGTPSSQGRPARGHRPGGPARFGDGDPARKPFRGRRGPVGKFKSAVRRTGSR